MLTSRNVWHVRLGLALAMVASACNSKPDDTTKVPAKQAPAVPAKAAPQPQPEPQPTAAATPTPADSEDYSFDRALRPEDLQGRSLRELALMRNTIYARKGQPFRKRWLHDFFSAKPWYKPGAFVYADQLSELDRSNAHLIAQAETTISAEELMKRFDALNQRQNANLALPHDDIEHRLLAIRLGMPSRIDTEEALSPLEDPKLLDAQLSVEQLNDLSRRDLRMLRNMVYARRGRTFHSELLTQYFKAASWYHPDPSYAPNKLSVVDQHNIRLIRSVEDSLGGPLSDRDHMEEEGWLDQA